MALGDAKHQPQRWTISTKKWSITLLCPRYFAGLLAQTLTGWTITETHSDNRAMITVRLSENTYLVDADVLESVQIHHDIIDALNEVLVCLSYTVTNQTKGAVLLHCAAYGTNNACQIIVGEKNSGKSTVAYHHACSGQSIAADDLLIWIPRQGVFCTLGLPIRMRRPVLSPSGALADAGKFFAGAHIAYSRTDAFDIMPAGQTLLLDQLYTLGPNHEARNVPVLKITSTLKRHLIDDRFTNIKKQLME